MNNREKLVKIIETNLSEMFVEEYDKVSKSISSINEYLKSIEVNYTYEYNIFCKDFMSCSKKLVDNLTDEQLKELDSDTFTVEVFSFIIKNKIYDCITDSDKRAYLLAEFQLQKYLLNH